MNLKVVGSLYLVVGVLILLTEVYQNTRTDSSNWIIYLIGAGCILMGIARLRSKPPVR